MTKINLRIGDKIRIVQEDDSHYFALGTICEITGVNYPWGMISTLGRDMRGGEDLQQLLEPGDYELIE